MRLVQCDVGEEGAWPPMAEAVTSLDIWYIVTMLRGGLFMILILDTSNYTSIHPLLTHDKHDMANPADIKEKSGDV